MKLCTKHDEWMHLVLIINAPTKRQNGVHWACSHGCRIKVKFPKEKRHNWQAKEKG